MGVVSITDQSYQDNNNTPFDPTDNTYIDVADRKSFLSSGVTGSDGYAPYGTVSPDRSTALTDDNGDRWVYYDIELGNPELDTERVNLANLQTTNGQNLDTMSDYLQNNPYQIVLDTSSLPPAPPAPQITLNNDGTLTLTNASDYNHDHPLLVAEDGTVVVSEPDRYLLYFYNSNNPADGQQLDVGYPYFLHGEHVKYETYNSDPNTLSVRIYDATTNQLGPVLDLPSLAVSENQIPSLKVYPNPASSNLNISIDGQLDDIEIYNMAGELVKEFDPQGSSQIQIPVNDLSQGFYLIHIWDKDGQKSVQKLVKN